MKKPKRGRSLAQDHYINNKKFLEALVARRAELRAWELGPQTTECPRVSNYIGECIHLLCTRLGRRGNFSGYTFVSEMVGSAIETCVRAVDKFDPTKSSNPFGYFSRIAWRSFCRQIELESDQTYVKIKALEELRVLDVRGEVSDGRGRSVGTIFTDDFVRDFEDRRAKKKQRRAERLSARLRKRKRKRKIV